MSSKYLIEVELLHALLLPDAAAVEEFPEWLGDILAHSLNVTLRLKRNKDRRIFSFLGAMRMV